MEVDTDVKRYHDIIFGWDVLNWTLESNCVFRYHDRNGLIVHAMAEAALKTWLNNTCFLSKGLPKSVHTIWNEIIWSTRARETAA
jgi:hypothetical protein